MREFMDSNIRYTNHIDQNIQVVKKLNDINKICFLSKIKSNIENRLISQVKMEQRQQNHRHK